MFSPTSFTLNDSLMMSVMQTLGGIGSLYGSIPGAAIIGGLPEALRTFTTGARIASLRFSFDGITVHRFNGRPSSGPLWHVDHERLFISAAHPPAFCPQGC